MKARDPRVVGIDVSKSALVVSSYGTGKGARAQQRVPQEASALESLVKAFVRDGVRLVAVESTGGYERDVLKAVHAAKIAVAQLSPEQVKAFARSQRKRAKTDEIDCQIIADYVSVTDVALWAPATPEMEAVSALLRHRDTLIRERTREKNRLKMATVGRVRDSIGAHINYLSRAAKGMEKELLARIKADPQANARLALLVSVPGVGTLTAARLVAELPELGTISKQKVSSLAGLAPMNRDSGELEGHRHCAPGRRGVKTALYQAANSAVLFNPVIRAFYARLRTSDKERKPVVTACAHKLLVILSAMVRHGENWDPSRNPVLLEALPEEEVRLLESDLADLEAEPEPTTPASEPSASAPRAVKPAAANKQRPAVKKLAKPAVPSESRRSRPPSQPPIGI